MMIENRDNSVEEGRESREINSGSPWNHYSFRENDLSIFTGRIVLFIRVKGLTVQHSIQERWIKSNCSPLITEGRG